MPFCPKEVQRVFTKFLETHSWLRSETAEFRHNRCCAIFWKRILSFKTLQSAWGKALDDVLYNQKTTNLSKRTSFFIVH